MERGILVCVALAMGAVVACSDPRAGTLPPPSPSPTSLSPPPSSTATAPGNDALIAAATQYYKTLERVAAQPSDVERLRALVHAKCDCRDVITLLERLRDEGHRLSFTVRLSGARVARAEASSATVMIAVRQSAGHELDNAGRVVRELPATSGTYALDLISDDGRLLVRRITKTS